MSHGSRHGNRRAGIGRIRKKAQKWGGKGSRVWWVNVSIEEANGVEVVPARGWGSSTIGEKVGAIHVIMVPARVVVGKGRQGPRYTIG